MNVDVIFFQMPGHSLADSGAHQRTGQHDYGYPNDTKS